jgi:peptide deformylase
MSILQLAILGQPVLRTTAAPVGKRELKDAAFQAFLDDLVESMRFHDGVGLAAPQVFWSKRVFVVEVAPEMDERGEGLPATVFINPEIVPLDDTMELGWEGCLSLGTLRGLVPRHRNVTLKALDRRGRPVELELSGFPARVVQHELDHLDGIVFVDRMPDLSSLAFEKELGRQRADGDDA